MVSHTLTAGLSISIRCSTRASTPAGISNRKTRRPTWTAAAPTRESYTSSDPVVHIFTDGGWRWGGYWTTPDYQHFERP